MPRTAGFAPLNPNLEDNPSRRISSVDPRLSRTNYFDGRLLTASDLVRDQLYLDERLREVGRVLGHGIVRGLELSLDFNGVLTVQPGLAVAPSGRVLELAMNDAPASPGDPLQVNLFDAAQRQSLNPDIVDRLESGLYVVAMRNAQSGKGVSEVFPKDLEGERGFHFNVREEGVELFLVPTDWKLPGTTRNLQTGRLTRRSGFVTQRSALVREFIANQGQPPVIGDDAVALGLLAMEHGQPLWLDEGLVRREHRAPGTPNQWQRDLLIHYESLLDDVIEERVESGRSGGFSAASYFQILPPAGRMPVDGVDPENGLQSFFPSHFDLEIAPVRIDDLPTLLAEAEALDPIDLTSAAPAELIVLAALGDVEFSRFARQLEFDPKTLSERGSAYDQAREAFDAAIEDGATASEITALQQALESYDDYSSGKAGHIRNLLPSLDNLTLRLRQPANTDVLDTDSTIWSGIYAAVRQTGDLWFMRRPPRAAETGVSAIVLARGYEPPEPGTEPGTDTELLEQQLAEATDALANANTLITNLQARVEALQDTLENNSDQELAAAQNEISRLNGELAAAEAQAELVPGLQERTGELERLLSQTRAEIARLEARLANNTEAEELRATVTRVNEQLRRANAQISDLENRLRVQDVDLDAIVKSRRISDEQARNSAAKLAEILRDSPEEKQRVVNALSLVPSGFEHALWPTLLEVTQRSSLKEFAEVLQNLIGVDKFGSEMASALPNIGVGTAIAALWEKETSGRVSLVDTTNMRIRSLNEIASDRGIGDRATLEAVRRVNNAIGSDRTMLQQINIAAALVPQRYDPAFWTSLERVVERGRLEQFVKTAQRANESGASIGLAFAANAQQLQLQAGDRNRWTELDLERG